MIQSREKVSFAKLREVLQPPDLLQLEKESFQWFLREGLDDLMKSVFPITDISESVELQYAGLSIEPPRYDPAECRERDMHYAATMKARFRLVNRETGEMKEQDVLFGTLPVMTDTATFIINGAERTVVSQLTRSSGVYFDELPTRKPTKSFHCKVIPNRGSWVEMESDEDNGIVVRLERARRIPATMLLKALGFGETTEDVLARFADKERLEKPSSQDVKHAIADQDIKHPETGELLVPKGRLIPDEIADDERLWKKMGAVQVLKPHPVMVRTALNDKTRTSEEALLEIFKSMRPGDPQQVDNARSTIEGMFFDPKRYDLGPSGRFQINKKFRQETSKKDLNVTSLQKEDFLQMVHYLLKLHDGEGRLDDVDHLGNRRVRAVGELLANHMRTGFTRMAKMVQERMMIQDKQEMTPQTLVNIRPVVASINEFFGTGQLSQFLDQTNPLAELTHKRRLSAMGPGGLTRERAGIEVRDVHHTHYGRICPIETPEGPNIGLINSLCVYARPNRMGFIETPYRKVEKGKVSDQVEYLTADDEDRVVIAQANAPLDEKGYFARDRVQARFQQRHLLAKKEDVNYMDVSPKQIVSVSAALIPFLEHDDANRALMGSNMQRQAVPLVQAERPLVGTGLEGRVATDSGAVIVAAEAGEVKEVSAQRIVVQQKEGGSKVYHLRRFSRSNQGTCLDHRPIVRAGDKVRKGQVIADGPATRQGELALGRNVLVAFMPWGGYNFEDAIILSERLVKEDVYTSIHIEEHETEARDTKLGPEEITRETPNASDEMLKNLDEEGIVCVGAQVRSDDILVGKITPKGETELTPEERLLRAIFGEKAKEVRDTSLRVPHGEKGVVLDVRTFSRQEGHELAPGVNRLVRVFVAQKRRIQEGDKMAGRHGNKGVISKIFPEEEMPFLPDGTPVDIVLNSLGVPSRMNLGQILEAHLGWAAYILGIECESPVFAGATEREIRWLMGLANLIKWGKVAVYDAQSGKRVGRLELEVDDSTRRAAEGSLSKVAQLLARTPLSLYQKGGKTKVGTLSLEGLTEARLREMIEACSLFAQADVQKSKDAPLDARELEDFVRRLTFLEDGKVTLYDGKTGEPFDQRVTVGYVYMMKLIHMVDDKIHARSTGPYALVTQQPLGGKAQFGGQRFGEMEVWALEAYGAAYTLQELLTVKSDDVVGRVKTYEAIIRGDRILEPGVPESFKVLVKELQSLGIELKLLADESKEVPVPEMEEISRSAKEELQRGLA